MPAGDITQGYIFVPAEKSIDQVKMNAIVGNAYINPAFISAQTVATTTSTGDYFVFLQSGGTLAKIVFDNLANSLAPTINQGNQAQIWNTRLRSFNSVGNCNFEVDQRNVFGAITGLGVNVWIQDRWQFQRSGTLTGTVNSSPSTPAFGTTQIVVPGTSFAISSKALGLAVGTAQVTLAASDYVAISQTIEGPFFRELCNDVHSVSLLVFSNLAGLKFSVSLRDPGLSRTLVKLCTIPTANTWTLITLPNMPVWPTAGNFSTANGVAGYGFSICLASGTTLIAPAADTWQGGNFLGAPGMSNFMATSGNSFFCAFVQHESGNQSSQLMDLDFQTNLFRAQRYFQKTYGQAVKPGNALDNAGANLFFTPVAGATLQVPVRFPVTMAKIPTMTLYSNNTGASGVIRNSTTGADIAATVSSPQDSGYSWINITGTAPAASANLQWHHTADTGW